MLFIKKIYKLEVLFQMKANIQIVLTFVIFKEWNIHLTICRSSIATEPSLLWSFWEAYETFEWQPNSELDDWTSCNFFETSLAPYDEKYQFSEKNNLLQVWTYCKHDYKRIFSKRFGHFFMKKILPTFTILFIIGYGI